MSAVEPEGATQPIDILSVPVPASVLNATWARRKEPTPTLAFED